MFHLYSKNKLDELAGRFLAVRREHPERFLPADSFTPECVIVQTRGMATYLQQYQLRQGETLCNTAFPFLSHQLEQIMLSALPAGRYRTDIFTAEALPWRIMALLDSVAAEFPRLARYFADGGDRELRQYQLSLRIARVFDQYQIYRPDLLRRWMADGPAVHADEAWQRDLWRKLRAGGKLAGRAELLWDFIRLERVPAAGPVSVFGVSTMPPYFLKVLKKYSLANEVNFFYLNVCAEYWAEHPMRHEKSLRECGDPELEFVNPLLAAWGLPGRNFFREILNLDHDIDEEMDIYIEPGDEVSPPATVLGEVQERILSATGGTLGRRRDDSITVHNCPGKMRQTEILHDKLLYLLRQKHYTLNDIIVMAPDINEFVPFIQSVFDRGPLQGSYSICDRTVRSTNLAAAALLRLLELRQGRFELSQVWQLLESPELRQKFNFDEQSMELLRSLLTDAAIRWGTDETMRLELFGVAFGEFSWRSGLDRLLAGLALEDDPAAPAKGPVPLNAVTSADGMVVLGNLCLLFDRLAAWCRSVPDAAPVAVWRQLLERLPVEFMAPDDGAPGDYSDLVNALGRFFAVLDLTNPGAVLPFEVISAALANLAETPAAAQPFLNGKISFSSLTPMRSVPGKVIVLLGMDESAFPRLERKVEFDLTPEDASYVYRSREWQDRYLFLESLLSARDYLLIFYSGLSHTDRARFAPATVVAELLDELAAPGVERPCKEYPLQGFDPVNFMASEPGSLLDDFSFSGEYYRMIARPDAGRTSVSFWEGIDRLEPESVGEREFDLRQIERYFCNPVQYFLVNRLGFGSRYDEDELLSDDEPLIPERRTLSSCLGLVGKCGDDADKLEQLRRRLAGQNMLPPAALGELAFANWCQHAKIEDQTLRQNWLGQIPLVCTVPLAAGILSGTLAVNPDGGGLTDCCYRPLGGKYLIRFLLRHLLLTATRTGVTESVLRGRTDADLLVLKNITPIQATGKLNELLQLFAEGKNQLLPLFARASVAQALGASPSAVKAKFAEDLRYDLQLQALFDREYLRDEDNFARFASVSEQCFGMLRGGTA